MNALTIRLQKAMILSFSLFLILQGSVCLAHSKDMDQLILQSVDQFQKVQDYTCRLDKKVNKDGTLYEDPEIFVKYKKPKHYYFRWEQGRFKGQEAIFVSGKYDDKIVAHSGGLFRYFTFHLNPEGNMAMERNRHSLNDSGLEKIMYLIETNYDLSKKTGIGDIRYLGEDWIDGKEVSVVYCVFPEDRGFYAHRIIVCFDTKLHLPIKASVFDWSNVLLEEYIFRDLIINVGFTRYDFDPGNPEYNYLSYEN